jgi:thiamine pyrophosphokinase
MDIRQNDRLKFDVPTVLFGASPIGPSVLEIAQKFESWPVLAADGGVNAAINAGLLPQMVIGDMDSVTELDQLPVSVQQIRLSGQDDTDLEKCLRLINAPLIVGIGFLDGRLDHSLAALDAMARLEHDRPVLLAGSNDAVLRLRGDIKLFLNRGCRVSIWPLGCQHFIRSEGLDWPLDNLTMQMGHRTGTSNRTNAGKIAITAGRGDGYAVIVPLAAFDKVLDAVL